MMQTFTNRLVGQQSTFTATFKNDAGDLVDPTTVTFKTKISNGVEISYNYGTETEVTRLSLGVYEFAAPTYASRGTFIIRTESTNPATANEATLKVEPSSFS